MMGLLSPLASLLGLETESILARAKSVALIYSLVALFGLLALGFFLAAGFMALADFFGGLYAALIMAGVFLLLALAILIGARIGQGRRQQELAEKRRASETGAFLTTAAITALPLLGKSPTLLRFGLPAAAIAAFLMLRKGRNED